MLKRLVYLAVLILGASKTYGQRDSLGRKLFEKLGSEVLVVKTATSVDAPRRSYGSGFAFQRDGKLITNFHVVSEAFANPKIYKVYVGYQGGWLTAEILNVDVTHDLALLKIPVIFRAPLQVSSRKMAIGDRVFSIGVPQDLNMSIVEGVYNGLIEMGPYEQVHLSTPLNSGMSGGPTVDLEGRLVGVNVAYLNDSQNLSFAVPAKYLKPLLKQPPQRSDLREAARFQLLEVQQQLTVTALMDPKLVSLPGWEILKPVESLKCYSDRQFENEKYFEETFHYCYLSNSSYLGEDISSGTYEVHFRVVQNKTLNSLQVFSLMEQIYNGKFGFWHDGAEYSEEVPLVTKYSCSESLVTNRNDVSLKVNYCLNAYVSYGDLYQADIKIVTLSNHHSTLFILMRFLGFERENIKRILQTYLESLRKI